MTTAEAAEAARSELRGWIQGADLGMGHPVRDECWLIGLSATTHRLIKFGVEDSFKHYSARELAHFQLLIAGEIADSLLRSTFTRAVIEGDLALTARLAEMPQAGDLAHWVHDLQADDAAACGAALAALPPAGEELATARLVVGRRFPDFLAAAWLDEVPSTHPTIAYHLALAMTALRPHLGAAVLAFLARHPAVLVAGEPDDLLAPLVRGAAQPPQKTMAPFAGYYGDGTLVAAAEWHLEHQQPDAAVELAQRVRRFSRFRHQARLVSGIALVGLGRHAEAEACLAALAGTDHADALALSLAEVQPARIGTDTVRAIMERCPGDRPERFFAGLRCLLARKDLATARAACASRRAAFAEHPQLGPMLVRILGG